MTTVLIKHSVEDFDKWKAEFDAFHDNRKASGEATYQIYRPIDNPNTLVILFEWDSMDNAKSFLESSDLKEAMVRAGVSSEPEITMMEMAGQGST
ncbi:MAG TPA: cyclase [Gammaproteobacteria bacterium]|nr:cyclase [Gammaproteobacteria bacterium]